MQARETCIRMEQLANFKRVCRNERTSGTLLICVIRACSTFSIEKRIPVPNRKRNINFIFPNLENMPAFLFRSRFIIALLFALLLLVTQSCKKTVEEIKVSALQSYFEQEILNRTYIVDYATDNGTDKTADFSGYYFVLTRTNSYIDGPMIGYRNNDTIRGTWTSSDDYGFLTINLQTPTPPPSFTFINRKWRFVRKEIPVMQLAPWGTTDAKVLNMRRL